MRKELAKIKLRDIKQVLKAHLQLEIRKLQMSLSSTIIFQIRLKNPKFPKDSSDELIFFLTL
jgi:hypothetical protein